MEQREPTPDEILSKPLTTWQKISDGILSASDMLPIPLNLFVYLFAYGLAIYVPYFIIDFVFRIFGIGEWSRLLFYILIPIPMIMLWLWNSKRYKGLDGSKSDTIRMTGYFK
ncbi:MAG: hypothetical protein OEM52_02770 [bacterium]|nr:hypothetical protein [bacterium]